MGACTSIFKDVEGQPPEKPIAAPEVDAVESIEVVEKEKGKEEATSADDSELKPEGSKASEVEKVESDTTKEKEDSAKEEAKKNVKSEENEKEENSKISKS